MNIAQRNREDVQRSSTMLATMDAQRAKIMDKRDAAILALWEDGTPWGELCQLTGLAISAVSDAINRACGGPDSERKALAKRARASAPRR